MKWAGKGAESPPQFVPQPGSALDEAHGVVSRWMEESIRALDERLWYQDVELKSQPSGRIILEAKPNEARRYVHAAVLQAAYYDGLARQFRAQATTDLERSNPHLRPGWSEIWVRRRRAAEVVSTLMRRKLPFEEEQLLALLDWCNNPEAYALPAGHIVRALERFLETHALSDALRE